LPKQKKRNEREISQPFLIGDWQIDPASGHITRRDESVKLEPRVMDVLTYLAAHPGKVVPREEMEATIWQGRVVGYDALTSTMLKLRKALNDDPHHPQFIETVPKRGYRLVADVQPLANIDAVPAFNKSQSRNVRRTVIGLIALMLLIMAIFWINNSRVTDAPAPQPGSPATIAVLPFDNLGDDPTQQYFADGMTDDLITDLTQLSGLHVISRDSVFLYRNEPVSIAQAAAKLNVRYVLHGSVRRANDRIRINVQLVDAESDTQLWAERYDSDVQDIFTVQDQFAEKIVSALSLELTQAEKQTLAREDTDNLDAYEKFLRGEEHLFQYSRDGNLQARKLFEDAIELDDQFARAYAMLAWTHAMDFQNGWGDAPEQSLQRGEQIANQALKLNNELPVAYFVRGLMYRERGEYVKALVDAEKAIELDPSYANGRVLMATLLYYAGRPEEGLARIKQAIALHPHHPYNYPFHLGQAYYVLGRYGEAIAALQQGLASNPASERMHVWLAAAYAQSGNIEDAEWEMGEVLLSNPDFRLDNLKRAFPFSDPADLEHFMEGLRKAGFRELTAVTSPDSN
jgi:TolB-like protein/DNA-binding winged helix-turn-helix (wHTH) protein